MPALVPVSGPSFRGVMPTTWQPEEGNVSHHEYEIKAGQLLVDVAANVYVGIALSFYIWDKKTKIAAYCFYHSDWSDKQWQRNEKAGRENTGEVRRIGLGRANSEKTITLAAQIDMKWLAAGASGKLIIVADSDSSSKMTATVTLDKWHVQLRFPILATVSGDLLKTRGHISGTTDKTSHPKLPTRFIKDPSEAGPE
jgi:hypothetical protein